MATDIYISKIQNRYNIKTYYTLAVIKIIKCL